MKNILTIALVIAGLSAKAQYFQHLYGTSDDDFLSCGHNAYSGSNTGHFLIGPAGNANPNKINVQRTDIDGNVSGAPYFNNTYFLTDNPGNPVNLTSHEVRSLEFSDGSGFAIAGGYVNGSINPMGVYYTYMDQSGNVMSSSGYFTSFGSYTDVHVQAITESVSNPGDLYICGYFTDATTGFNRVFILKINQAGTLLWGSTYDLTGTTYLTDSDIPYDIIESTVYNSQFNYYEVYVVGEHTDNSAGAPQTDAFLLKVNSVYGVTLGYPEMYGTPNSRDVFTCIQQSANTGIDANAEGFVIGGYSDMMNSYDFWFVAIDYSRNIVWDHLFNYFNGGPTNYNDYCNHLIERENTSGQYEYYLAGYTDQGFFGGGDVVVIKTDNSGNAVSNGQFTYGETDIDVGIRIDQLNGYGRNTDGIAVYGYSWHIPPYTIGARDHFLVKAYFNGVTACNTDLQDPEQLPGQAMHEETGGEFYPYDYYDFAFQMYDPQSLQESEVCYQPSDRDGDNSSMVPVKKEVYSSAVLMPNPMRMDADKEVVLEVTAETDAGLDVGVYDLLGREYYRGQFRMKEGDNRLSLDLSGTHLPAGVYLIKLSGAGENRSIVLFVK